MGTNWTSWFDTCLHEFESNDHFFRLLLGQRPTVHGLRQQHMSSNQIPSCQKSHSDWFLPTFFGKNRPDNQTFESDRHHIEQIFRHNAVLQQIRAIFRFLVTSLLRLDNWSVGQNTLDEHLVSSNSTCGLFCFQSQNNMFAQSSKKLFAKERLSQGPLNSLKILGRYVEIWPGCWNSLSVPSVQENCLSSTDRGIERNIPKGTALYVVPLSCRMQKGLQHNGTQFWPFRCVRCDHVLGTRRSIVWSHDYVIFHDGFNGFGFWLVQRSQQQALSRWEVGGWLYRFRITHRAGSTDMICDQW